MARTALQLYSIADVGDDTATMVETVAETSFDGVEFAGIDGDPTAVADALGAGDLEAPSAHVPIEDLEADLEDTLDTYRELGVEHLVVPFLPPEHFESRAAIEATAERLSAVADSLPAEFTLHYHNHDHEFVEVAGRPAIEHLLELTTDLQVEPDLGWIGVAGYDPVAWLEANADRVTLVHVKDYAEGGQPVEGGTGDLDLDSVAAIADEAGLEWLIYEHEERQNAYETARNGAAYLEPYGE